MQNYTAQLAATQGRVFEFLQKKHLILFMDHEEFATLISRGELLSHILRELT